MRQRLIPHSEIVKTICYLPIRMMQDDAEDICWRIEIHRDIRFPNEYFAVLWRLETYCVKPSFQPDNCSNEMADHALLIVDDCLTEKAKDIRAATPRSLIKKIMKLIECTTGIKGPPQKKSKGSTH